MSNTNCSINERIVDMAMPCLYFLLFLPGLLLNGMAAWISLRLPEKSTFTVYLKNLVAADLLMTLCIPLKATSDLHKAPVWLKAFACRYSTVLFYFSMYISILLMGVISLDRYLKIVRSSRRFFCQNLTFSRVLSTSLWIMLFCATGLPTMVLTNRPLINITSEYCMSQKGDAGKKLHKGVTYGCIVMFCVVCILIIFCYICITRTILQSYRNSKCNKDGVSHKTKARVFIILAVFLICFFPYHALRIPYTLFQMDRTDSCKEAALRVTKKVLLWLSSTNICLDPLIYFFLCRSFREKVLETWICRTLSPVFVSSSNETSL
ncbi:P2Y purinoceptor 13-like [Megalops cyprinoides]|uniref:P2Y purinoceptor 13-like n=1 Tax=Megalops cyprinoides TaxID=118141 RepID=UPI00186485A0|nr:P2Y purinoceptor 13-like [Megalops cyprinoides]